MSSTTNNNFEESRNHMDLLLNKAKDKILSIKDIKYLMKNLDTSKEKDLFNSFLHHFFVCLQLT